MTVSVSATRVTLTSWTLASSPALTIVRITLQRDSSRFHLVPLLLLILQFHWCLSCFIFSKVQSDPTVLSLELKLLIQLPLQAPVTAMVSLDLICSLHSRTLKPARYLLHFLRMIPLTWREQLSNPLRALSSIRLPYKNPNSLNMSRFHNTEREREREQT